jgi:hypothetical protein
LDGLLSKYPDALQTDFQSLWERQVQAATSLYPPPPVEILELALTGKPIGENTRVYQDPFYTFEINGIEPNVYD